MYGEKLEKYQSPVKLYCSDPECSAFIPRTLRFGVQGVCAKCRHVTCMLCQQEDHAGDCEEDEERVQTLSLARTRAWKHCPECGHLIEKSRDCDDMR
jgi:hypothetical protein